MQRSFERIVLLFFSFGNPLSHFVGVNAARVAPTMDGMGQATKPVESSEAVRATLKYRSTRPCSWRSTLNDEMDGAIPGE
ncbi:MAG: hypothetical protein AUH94_03700 [Ktedonobacter sp. 13_2_20CM_2_54_8]|nr:MAG: hypothetical protein AUH94_03700 [Ktedonobacter sp. 13_2_20CM_2_54_8]